MSQLPPADLSYETVVSEYFLGLRGAGLMLSPLDLEQVRAWQRRGLPVAVVCRGLRRGLEEALRHGAPGSPAPRSVRAYRGSVEAEWRAYAHGRVGEAPPGGGEEEVAARRLASARALLDRGASRAVGALAAAHQAAARRLALEARGAAVPDLRVLEAAFAEVDALLVTGWLRALGRAERAALGRRCRAAAGARPAGCTRRAYRSALRTHLVELARGAGLLLLQGSV